jgi:uncharacterized coiled-coil protein SlyX
MSDLEERVRELEDTVAFLEDELDVSYEEVKFRHRMESLAPQNADVEVDVDDGPFVHRYASIDSLDTDGLNQLIHRLQSIDELSFEVVETGTNLGVEVWDER